MTGGQVRPLLVAGVAGGVGTSTWIRILRQGYPGLRIEDLRDLVPLADELGRLRAVRQNNGAVDILVSSNTAAAAARIGPALALCPRPPLLVVMHTAAWEPAETRAHLRKITPHIAVQIDIAHHRVWLGIDAAPGQHLSEKARDISDALARFPERLRAMYATPAAPAAQFAPSPNPDVATRPPVAPARPSALVPRAGPPPPSWRPPPGGGPARVIHRGSQGG